MRKMSFVSLLAVLSLFIGYSPEQHATYLPLVATTAPRNGAAWAWGQNPADAELLSIDWYYNYGVRGNPRIDAQFVPFLWCDRWPPHDYANGRDYFQLWRDNGLTDYSGYALILNEPDLAGSDRGGQCDRTPRQAAYIYRQALEICPGCKWVGPVTSDMDYRRGWVWQRQFYNYIMGWRLPMPAVGAIHTYLVESPQLILDSYFAMLSEYPNSPTTAWVTEFGNSNPAVVNQMLHTWQDDPRITRWAYFAPRIPANETHLHPLTLIDPNGSLTAVGRAYVAALRR